MKLTEILNKKVDYEVVKSTSDTFKTRATIGDREIVFTAYPVEDGEGTESWEITFGEKLKNGMTTFDQTGSGNELEVFSMVKDSIMEFINIYSPQTITFTADKDNNGAKNNRAELYSKLISKFKAPNYEVDRKSLGQGADIFRIVRK